MPEQPLPPGLRRFYLGPAGGAVAIHRIDFTQMLGDSVQCWIGRYDVLGRFRDGYQVVASLEALRQQAEAVGP
uniref:Uncharacterized protein n=1 Tax=viral metagenome TaxID=1070528 RepID=A0A6M3J1M2_9ZZZZ